MAMKRIVLSTLLILLPSLALGQISSEMITYKQGDATMQGYLAFSKSDQRRPGILIVHDWMGLGEHYKQIANKLAEMGYVAFAADIYGNNTKPADSGEAAKLAGKLKADRQLLRERTKASLKVLQENKMVDPKKIAAIGYCFGGTTVLELARSGADIAGVISFHGGLETPDVKDSKNIKAEVLALHGADDPFVPPKEVEAFQDEMRKGNVDWQMIIYGNNVHSFTTPGAGTDKSKGAAYDATADRRSWEAMKSFFNELFK
jgi:dienelactone hydrolase